MSTNNTPKSVPQRWHDKNPYNPSGGISVF